MLELEGFEFKRHWLILARDKNPTLDYLEVLAASDPACFASAVERMKKLADRRYHCEPTVKRLQGSKARGLFELRVLGSKNHLARFPLMFTSEREVVLLFGVTKKGKSPPPGFIEKAIRYRNMINTKEAQHDEIDFSIFDEI